MYGTQIKAWRGTKRDVIGEVGHSMGGNVILEVGSEETRKWGGWFKKCHVILTPEETKKLIEELKVELQRCQSIFTDKGSKDRRAH